MKRQIQFVCQDITDEQMENLLKEPENADEFVKQKLMDVPHMEVVSKVNELQEYNTELKKLAVELKDLNQMFLDMASLVRMQGERIDKLEQMIANVQKDVARGVTELNKAKKHYKQSSKLACWLLLIVAIILCAIFIPMIT